MDASSVSKTATFSQMRWWHGEGYRIGVADRWHCPCGRLVRPSDVEMVTTRERILISWVCSSCHADLERIEIPL